jgi:AbrB family looped-hinge helix DNA binding protein
MSSSTLSSKYQLVIPKEIREIMNLQPGMEFQLIPYGGQIVFVPIRSMRELRGILKGKKIKLEREKTDRPL